MKKYSKPKISIKKIKLNFFFKNDIFISSDGSFLDPNNLLATCYSDCLPGCFLENTKILLADNTSINIQNVKQGDHVWSYDTEKKVIIKNTVKELLIHPNMPNGYYVINGIIRVTGNHNFWVNKTSWERVDKLKVGDSMLDHKGQEIPIISMKYIDGVYTIYNFHTLNSNAHNYFADGVLVHNYTK